MPKTKQIAILGSGSWGNTLACHFADEFDVLLWDYKDKRVELRKQNREFDRPEKGIYPESVNFTSSIEEVLNFSDFIFNVVPLKGIPSLVESIDTCLANSDLDLKSKVLINCSKGIDLATLKTPAEIFQEFFKKQGLNIDIAAFAGPNLAREVLAQKPMIATIASENYELAKELQLKFSSDKIRLYSSNDLIGVEFCSALKNVIAIAAGASDGLALGASTKASLITRALNELRELIRLKGGDEETLYTAAGLGDLIATCNSDLSRNYRVGYFMAQNMSLEEINKKLNSVAEGVNTSFALEELNKTQNLRIPICIEVASMLKGTKSPREVASSLMARELV